LADTDFEANILKTADDLPPLPVQVTAEVESKPKPRPKINPKRTKKLRVKKTKKAESESKGGGCSFRLITCSGCSIFLILILVIVILLLTRPVWLNSWLNAGLQEVPFDGTTVEGTYSRLGLQVSDFEIGDNNLVITENQVRAIIAETVGYADPSVLNVDIEQGVMNVFTDIDPGNQVPLYLDVTLGVNDDQLVVRSVGTGRIGVPEFVNEAVMKMLFAIIGVAGEEDQDLISTFLSTPENVNVTSVQLSKDKMIISMYVSTGLEDIFIR